MLVSIGKTSLIERRSPHQSANSRVGDRDSAACPLTVVVDFCRAEPDRTELGHALPRLDASRHGRARPSGTHAVAD